MRHLRSVLLASALILPLGAPAVLAATPEGVLVVAQNIDDIVAIDPAQAYEFTSGELVTNIYDRLVQYDAEDPTVLAPGLASEWTKTPRPRPSPSRCATAPRSTPAIRCAPRTWSSPSPAW